MTATAGTPGWEDIARTWGGHYTFTFDPEDHPDEPHAAHRKDDQETLRAISRDELLDKIKDDIAGRPFGASSTAGGVQ
jgi:hypothetical protein